MITNYVYPQSTITQLVAVTTVSAAPRLNAVVIGPQYRLTRYGIDAKVTGTAFASAGLTVPWTTVINGTVGALPSTDVVDLSSVGLFGENMMAEYASFATGDAKIYLADLSNPSILRIATTTFSGTAGGRSLDTKFYGRPVQIGDVVVVNDQVSGPRTRKVIGLIGANVASSYGSDGSNAQAGNSVYNPQTNAVGSLGAALTVVSAPAGYSLTLLDYTQFNALVKGSRLGNYYGEDFILTVATGGAPGTATFNISSASGLWSASNVLSTVNSSTKYAIAGALAGLTAIIDPGSAGPVVAGQIFRFQVKGAYTRLGATQLALADTGSGYTGPLNTTYVIQVVTGTATGYAGAVLKIYDTAGVDVPSTVTLVDDATFPLGTYGLEATFSDTTTLPQGGLRTGDSYFVQAVAGTQSATIFDKIVLDGPASDTTLFQNLSNAVAASFRITYTGALASGWTSDAVNGIVIAANLSLHVPSRTSGHQDIAFLDGVGLVYPSYRSLVPPVANEGLIKISSPSDISTLLGSYGDQANDLAYGAQCALSGANGNAIFALRTAGTDVGSYNAAFQKISSSSSVYALAVVTSDVAVGTALRDHVEAMSAKNVKNFRRGYFGTDSPVGLIPVLVTQVGGSPYMATLSTLNGQNVLLTCTTAGVDFTTLSIASGDTVTLPSLGGTYLVDSVISATELKLQSGPTNPVSPATAMQLFHANTPQAVASVVIGVSKSLNSRRIAHVWQESGNVSPTGVAVLVPNKFIACEIAGLRCALYPQQGLTRTEITSISNAPAMYLKYPSTLIDTIAANGTMVIQQLTSDGPCFIRHQLTTKTDSGSLYYEDSPGVVLDFVSLSWNDIQDGYIGKKNAVPATVSDLNDKLTSMLNGFTKQDLAVSDFVGPMLAGFSNVSVRIGTLKDQIISSASLQIGLPLNYADTTFEAETIL